MTINDLPILEPNQFVILSRNLPKTNEIIAFATKSKYMDDIRKPESKWEIKACKVAREIHFNKQAQIFIRHDAIDEYGHDVATNAFRYLKTFSKGTTMRVADGVAAMAWLVDHVVDMDATIKENKWEF